MKTKFCKKCKKEKDISEFSKYKRAKDGLYYQCKECNKEYSKEYYEKNKERIKKRELKRINKNPKKLWCQQTINGHKYRGYEVLFNWQELYLIVEKSEYCLFCNNLLDWSFGNRHSDNSPTLDRTNNDNVLTLRNIQILCRKCNTTKYNRTMKQFIEYCKMITNKFD